MSHQGELWWWIIELSREFCHLFTCKLLFISLNFERAFFIPIQMQVHSKNKNIKQKERGANSRSRSPCPALGSWLQRQHGGTRQQPVASRLLRSGQGSPPPPPAQAGRCIILGGDGFVVGSCLVGLSFLSTKSTKLATHILFVKYFHELRISSIKIFLCVRARRLHSLMSERKLYDFWMHSWQHAEHETCKYGTIMFLASWTRCGEKWIHLKLKLTLKND